jgi:hypothetical protein
MFIAEVASWQELLRDSQAALSTVEQSMSEGFCEAAWKDIVSEIEPQLDENPNDTRRSSSPVWTGFARGLRGRPTYGVVHSFMDPCTRYDLVSSSVAQPAARPRPLCPHPGKACLLAGSRFATVRRIQSFADDVVDEGKHRAGSG